MMESGQKQLVVDFNHASARRIRPAALAAAVEVCSMSGSPTAPHSLGTALAHKIARAEKDILSLLGADENDHFRWCSSGADAIAQFFTLHYIYFVRQTGRTHLISHKAEEAPILLNLTRLDRELGCSGKMVEVDGDGVILIDSLREAIKPRTGLISISHANSLTGAIQPLDQICELAREKDVRLHVDISQTVGALPFHFADLPIHFITCDGSVLGSPFGGGILIGKKELPLETFPLGSSGPSVAALVGFSEALKETISQRAHMQMAISALRARFESAAPMQPVLSQSAFRVPHICAMSLPTISSELALYALDKRGICASMGGVHCQKMGSLLQAMEKSPLIANGALSFQFSSDTTAEEIDAATSAIKEVIAHFQTYGEHLVGSAK